MATYDENGKQIVKNIPTLLNRFLEDYEALQAQIDVWNDSGYVADQEGFTDAGVSWLNNGWVDEANNSFTGIIYSIEQIRLLLDNQAPATNTHYDLLNKGRRMTGK